MKFSKNFKNNFSDRLKINSYNSYQKRRRKRLKRIPQALYIVIITIIILIIIIFLLILLHKINGKNNLNDNIPKKFILFEEEDKFFFFEKNQSELDYCEKYGLLIYEYYYDRKVPQNWGTNIGDYIQSLAALQYLPKNCKPYLIDRDELQFYNGTKIKLIMASWNTLLKGNKYISPYIEPILISYHLSNTDKLPSTYVENMKKFSPIGCRDIKTRDQFISYGINAYFSSCLTTTLDIDFAVDKGERNDEIIFIDYKFGNYPKADEFLYSLKAYNFSKITYTQHHFNIKLTHIQRFQLAKKLLDKYARAKLIISTRLHGALPSLACHTPVIFVNKKYDYRRYPGLYELLNTVGINSEGKFEIRVNISDKGFVNNPKKYSEYAIKLKEYLKNISDINFNQNKTE